MVTVRSRKTELAELVNLLESEHDSVEDLAEACWKLIDSQRTGRDAWLIAVDHGHGMVLCYGLYQTEAAALKEIAQYRSTTGNEKARILRLAAAGKIFNFHSESYR